jgi:hypothetical protein
VKKLMICLLGLPLALSGCVTDEEMASESPGARLLYQQQENAADQLIYNSMALAAHTLGTANQQ